MIFHRNHFCFKWAVRFSCTHSTLWKTSQRQPGFGNKLSFHSFIYKTTRPVRESLTVLAALHRRRSYPFSFNIFSARTLVRAQGSVSETAETDLYFIHFLLNSASIVWQCLPTVKPKLRPPALFSASTTIQLRVSCFLPSRLFSSFSIFTLRLAYLSVINGRISRLQSFSFLRYWNIMVHALTNNLQLVYIRI